MVKKKPDRASAAKSATTQVPDYRALLTGIKRRIRTAQIKASLAVNRELIQLYWDIGGLILRQQHERGWGRSVVEALASDLQAEFPGLEGFSPRNIWRMRAFHLAWASGETIPTGVRRTQGKLLRAVADPKVLPQPVAEIPWGHNVALLEKLKDRNQRLWYALNSFASTSVCNPRACLPSCRHRNCRQRSTPAAG